MLIIKNALVYTQEELGTQQLDIAVDGKRIAAVAKEIYPEQGDVIIDAEGLHLLPGFIDAHCHLGMWEDAIGFEGADGNEMTNPITPELRAIDAINPMDKTFYEARQGGVTTVATGPGSGNVIGGQFAVIKTFGTCIDDMIVKAPLAMKCAFGENPKRVYNDKKASPSTRMGIAAELRQVLYQAKSYMEKKDKGESQPEFNMKYEALLPVLRREIPLKAHAHRADDMFTALRIAKEFDVKITLEHCTEGHLIPEYLKAANVPVVVGPSFGERSKFELKELSFATPGVLSHHGIKVAIMTDHPVIPLQYLPLLAGLSVKAGMDVDEALKAITLYPAEILEIADRVGSIRVGKEADFVLMTEHPFQWDTKVIATYIGGECVYHD